ncbi:MAG: acetyl-CoA carboxylase [Oscillospiraceae bacterium]|nr:acetyl-CoA carboxylase [Oscillospiraceae bacterium]
MVDLTLLKQLFDENTFTEIQKHPDSGVIAGFGAIAGSEGTAAYAYIQDKNVKSGAVNQNAAAKMKKVYASAVKFGTPVVAIFNSKGGEISEGLELVDAYSEIIENAVQLSGVVPLISIVTGLCTGLNAVLCCMSDFVIMCRDAEMFFTPPFISEEETENAGTAEFNAGAGVANIIVNDALEGVKKARELLKYLPKNNLEPTFFFGYEENDINITDRLKSEQLIKAVANKDNYIEINESFGRGGVTALGVLDNFAVGFVALDKSDKLTADETAKIARFVNFCDAFSLPVISIIDNEGFEASNKAEKSGFVRDLAKLAQVYASATCPKINLITGKATGAAFILSGGFKSDFTLAYEGSFISPISVKAAAVFLEMSEDDYIKEYASVQTALEKGYIDAVITPPEVRAALITALNAVRDKRTASPKRKHINMVF